MLRVALLLFTSVSLAQADWPQWRGPDRNGTASDVTLPSQLSDENAPTEVWRSTEIPSDHYGGHGSVSVADGKVFLSVVWHTDEPTDTRQISSRVTGDLGNRGLNHWPKELVEKMEADRMGLSPRLRGNALDEWATKWTEENLDEKERIKLGSWVISRFKKGKSAIPISAFVKLDKIKNKTFPDQKSMEDWVNAQGFEPDIAKQIIDAVPASEKVANDVVLCLDATTGKELWKYEADGEPTGRGSSSTPAYANGKVYAALSKHLYCVDAATGNEVWKAEIVGKKGPASSPLVVDGKVFVQFSPLTAFNAETGEVLWTNKDVKATNSSPTSWKNLILCNSSNEVIGIDAATGETAWKRPGGGDGTPVVSGDYLVVSSKADGKNLIAYQMGLPDEDGPKELWAQEFLARRYGSSPIVHEGHVYHLGSERHLCVDLKTGEQKWERKVQSSISSPVLADGKLLIYENRGGFLNLLEAYPNEYTSLGRAKVGALYTASPALVKNRLFFRTKDSVACYQFGE